MEITVTGRNITVTPALRSYAEEKITDSMKAMDIEMTAEVELSTERNRSNALPCVCEVTLRTKGHVIRVQENENDMYAAIDIAAAKVLRQLRKYKTKVVNRRHGADGIAETFGTGDLDLDALMAELSGADEEIVRVKEVEFEPKTEEEALIAIDLLGHDFYGYIDRDTNAFCILYRRENGGYGLLKQADA